MSFISGTHTLSLGWDRECIENYLMDQARLQYILDVALYHMTMYPFHPYEVKHSSYKRPFPNLSTWKR